MRASLLIGLLVASAMPAAAAAPVADATWRFDAPATAGGSVQALTDGWLLLLAAPGATFDVDLPPATTVNHTTAWLQPRIPGAGSGIAVPLPDAKGSLVDPVRAHLVFEEGGSLLLAASRLEVTLNGSAELLAAVAGQAPMGDLLPKDAGASGAARLGAHPIASDGAAARSAPPSPPVRVQVRAAGLHLAEWHGAQVTCATPACVDGARATEAGGLGLSPARLESYLEVRPADGTIAGEGSAVAIAFGGTRMDVAANGWVRLPAARAVGGSPASLPDPAGATVYAEGSVVLAGLRHGGDDGLQAQVSGNGLRLRVGEAWLPPSAAVAGAAAAGIGLAWLSMKAAWALAARVLGAKAAEHPARQRLLEVAQAQPGLGLREACRRAGVPYATGVHHLAILRRARLVAFVRLGRRLLLCLPGAEGKTLSAAPARRTADEGRLLEAVNARTLPFQSDLVEHARVQWGWPASSTRHRLGQLVGAGLVKRRRLGLRVAYLPAEDGQAPAFPATHPVTPAMAAAMPVSSP